MRKVIHFTFFTAIGLLTVWLVLRNISLEALKKELLNARYIFVIISFAASFLAYLSRAVRWKILIEPLGYQVNIPNAFSALMTGYLANFIFPRIGEITRCSVLAKKEDIPTDKLIGTVILERAIDLLMLILFMIVLFFAKYSTFGTFILSNARDFISAEIDSFSLISLLPGAILTVLIGLGIYFYKRFKRHLVRVKFIRKLRKSLTGINQGLKTIVRLKKNMKFMFHTVFIWVMYWLMIYPVFFAIPATSQLDPVDGLFIMVMAGIGMAMPVQGGIGAFHAIVALSLTLYNIDFQTGFNFALLVHESQLLFGIFLGLLSVIVLYISKRRTGNR